MMASLAALWFLLQTASPPAPEPFAFSEMTVTRLEVARSITPHRRVSYQRVFARTTDGASRTLYVSSLVESHRRPQTGDICGFEGAVRPWIRGRDPGPYDSIWNRYDPVPAEGENLLMADRYECRPGPDSVPAPERPDPELPPAQTSSITVVGIGPKPDWASGTSILILGRSDDGDIDPYYLTFHGDEEPVPPLGGRCLIRHSRHRLEIVGGLQAAPWLKGEMFEEFDCTPPENPGPFAGEPAQ
jgi:hypothetical protein